MKDRFIGQNVRLLCDVLEQTELENIPGILLQLDFCKAFDTIEWANDSASPVIFQLWCYY